MNRPVVRLIRRIVFIFCNLLVASVLLGRPSITLAVGGPTITIDASAGQRYPISPYIYGLGANTFYWIAGPVDAMYTSIKPPLVRWGGNLSTRYNYQVNAANHGRDYVFKNLPEQQNANAYVTQARNNGAKAIMTIPMIGWVSKDTSSCSFPLSIYPNQNFSDGGCGDGVQPGGDPYSGPYITGNNPTVANVAVNSTFMQTWVNSFIGTFGNANNNGILFYEMDNEPNIWHDTHRDVYPTGLRMADLRNLTWDYAAKVKASDPNAKILGPSDDGWTRYFYGGYDSQLEAWGNPPDRNLNGGVPMAEWYLQQMKNYDTANGKRLLDYFIEHYYPAAPGVTLQPAGDAATQALRLRATRSLWDSTYTDESWIGGVDQAIRQVNLIPRMRSWVAANYPNTKTGITEYNFGGAEHINGAIAQAEVLGIFGRERLDLATWFTSNSINDVLTQPWSYAFKMFLNYDGAGAKFGETGVAANVASSTCADIGDSRPCLSAYAALRGSNTLTLMVINKSPSTSYTSTVNIGGFTSGASAQVYRYSSANLNAIVPQANQTITGNSFSGTFPAYSITLYIIPQGGALVRPDTIGIYKDGTYYLRNTNTTGGANITTTFGGDPGDLPVVGDWNGDGIDTVGIYRGSQGRYFLSNTNTSPVAAHIFFFGNPGDTPFAGKWTSGATGDGVGVYRNTNGILYQANNLSTGFADYFAIFGNPGDKGYAADWNADGRSSIGIYRPSETKWYMTNNSQPAGVTYGDFAFVWPISTSSPVVGDWDGDNIATVGYLTSAGAFVLHSTLATSGTDNSFAFGPTGSLPIAGKWTLTSPDQPDQMVRSAPPNGLLVPAGSQPMGGNGEPAQFD